jgi:hypothetical protein
MMLSRRHFDNYTVVTSALATPAEARPVDVGVRDGTLEDVPDSDSGAHMGVQVRVLPDVRTMLGRW